MLLITLLFASIASAVPTYRAVAQKCYSGVYVITARGTTEPQGYGLQQSIVQAILDEIPNSNSSAVIYPANFNVTSSLAIGVANAQQQITDYYNACPNSKIVLTGYSQGAQVIGNAIAGGGTPTPFGTPSPPATPISHKVGKNVVSVVMFGDPQRAIGQGVDNDSGSCKNSSSYARTGVNYNNMQFYANRLDEYCASGDPVCCSTGMNILAHLSYFNSKNAQNIASYVAGKFKSS